MTIASLPRKPLSAGSEIDAWCTRCKLDLGHRIVAMVGLAPKRVICLTCGSEHNYRAPKTEGPKKVGATRTSARTTKAASKSTAKTSAKSGARAAKVSQMDWQTAVRSGKPFRDYSIDKRFDVGELVMHKKFGEGYVAAIAGPQKLTVIFSTGEKTLIHDRTD